MNREILFRGRQAKNKEWIYGSVLVERDYLGTVIVTKENHNVVTKADVYYFNVIPETVGMYTGLTDKNGTKIFEGDILEGDLEDNLDPGAKWRSVVVMGKFGWFAVDRTGSNPTPLDEFDISEGEVIGNIHDNPELLKESAENE